ncbi:MAG: GDP-L-fucose synthase [Candidatus Omnitrophica bacterium]|nr:GDP-L-fucose synthase [Candidatus Omnitrophota bacterium]
MLKTDKIMVTGHTGMVGSAFVSLLKRKGYTKVITSSSKFLDLRNQSAAEEFIKINKPDTIFHFAARVGGIKANAEYPAVFLYDNLAIQTNVIHSAFKCGINNLLFLAGSCVYPRESVQPMKEEYLLNGPLEPTNEAYALAKIAGIKMCQFYRRQYGVNFISLISTNAYGIGDNFNLESSHVVPALIAKFYRALAQNKPEVKIWGTGKPVREFIYVDDLAYACFYVMKNKQLFKKYDYLNVGTGKGVSIKELSEIIKKNIGYGGNILYDISRPDGFPVKILDIKRILELGWKPKITLKSGLEKTCRWFMGEGIKRTEGNNIIKKR